MCVFLYTNLQNYNWDLYLLYFPFVIFSGFYATTQNVWLFNYKRHAAVLTFLLPLDMISLSKHSAEPTLAILISWTCRRGEVLKEHLTYFWSHILWVHNYPFIKNYIWWTNWTTQFKDDKKIILTSGSNVWYRVKMKGIVFPLLQDEFSACV